jgi:uncharacterized membrane protein YedE/YeeE
MIGSIAGSFGCGLIFGLGLMISGMTDTTRVLGFLDVFGRWDPTLAFVMAGALAVTATGYAFTEKKKPIFARDKAMPAQKAIDAPLIAGALIFGAGWGLVGLCPGPAITNLATASPQVVLFVIAMALGMMLKKVWRERGARKRKAALTHADG